MTSVDTPPTAARPQSVDRTSATPIQEVQRARQHALGDLLHRTSLRRPRHPAIVDGSTRLDFAAFNDTVNRLAGALRTQGLRKGDRLALLSHNNWQVAVTVFAAAKLGLVLVPINFMLGVDEISFILNHAKVDGLFVEDALATVGEQALSAAGRTDAVRGWIGRNDTLPPADGWQDIENWLPHASTAEPDAAIGDDDPLRLMYTSGTESRPKGVLLSSRSLISQYVSCAIDGGMTADDIEVHALPLYHCAQLDCFLGPDIYLGATSVILSSADPEQILNAIEREGATKLFAPPTVWISLLRSPHFDRADLSSLRKGYYGASAMPVEVLKEIQERLPELRLWNFYGQTEMAPVATILPPEEQISHAGSAGRPVLNVQTAVVGDDDHPVPAGTVGEIVHRSPQATLGYYLDDAKTVETFRGGWFHSGDLGVLDDEGRLSVVDRKKDMIKTGGENVASREVEEVIYQHPAVAEVAVFGIPHAHWVEAVTAVVVLRRDQTTTASDLIAHCRVRLAPFKTPKHVVFASALPKNPSGKVLKRDLRNAYASLAQEE